MSIIDFHSHILPGIDDGARNLDTSMAMLEQIREQKVDYMVATPHFYASKDRIDSFLAKRANAWELLNGAIKERQFQNAPQFFLGSEVAFFEGISRAEQIDSLTIGDTNLLLLEMPFVPWTMQNVREVEKLISDRKLHVIIAHLERFIWMPGNKKMIQSLLELPVTVQINAESFLEWKHRRALLKMFRDGTAHILGSDCHGAHHRVPNLLEGRMVIEKKAGAEVLHRMDMQGEKLLFGDR